MEGKILYYNEETLEGIIRTHDGNRFSFNREDYQGTASPRINMKVDFIEEGKYAKDIIPFTQQIQFQEITRNLPPVSMESGMLKRMLDFDYMITPKLVRILYLILLGIMIVTGIYHIFWADYYFMGGRATAISIGIACLLVGPIILRVFCEGILVVFKILETLKQLRKNYSNPSN